MKNYILYDRLKFVLVLIAKALSIFAMIAIAFCSSFVLQWALHSKNINSLFILAGVILSVVGGYFIFNFLNYRLTVYYAIGSINKLRKDFMFRLYELPYSTISKEDSSYYISLLSKDLTILEEQYFSGVFVIFENMALIVGSVIAIGFLHWSILLIMLLMSILLLIVPLCFSKALEKRTVSLSGENAKYIGKVKSIMQGIAVVYSYNAKKYFINQLNNSSDSLATASKKQSFLNSKLTLCAQTIVNLVQMCVIIYGGYLIYMQKIEAGELIALMSLVTMYFNPLVNLAGVVTMVQSTKPIRKKFLDVINVTPVKGETVAIENKDIVIKDLSYAYAERLVLDTINLNIKEGEKVLILGKSGSGKSTFLKLLAGLLPAEQGQIVIGEREYSKLRFDGISDYVSYVQQDSYLFNDSIKNNIVLSNVYEKNKFAAICDFCNINELITSFEQGADTVIDEEINQLSGGEKSRINLARAIYANKPIVLLDEVTSALDKKNTSEIEHRLLTLAGKTIILVSHKILEDKIDMFDKIIVMDDGKATVIDSKENNKKSMINDKYITRRQNV